MLISSLLPVITSLMLAVGVVSPDAGGRATDNGVIMLSDYFDLLVSGNHESARYYWIPAALERSSRFGIEYEGVPLKVDCNSPIVRNIGLMRDHLQPPVKAVETIDSNLNRLQYSHVVSGDLVEHSYWAWWDGSYYWLTYPQDYFAVDWPIEETRYFRIHVDPSARRQMNPVALNEIDRWVEDMIDSLDLSGDVEDLLEDKKIEYYYCGSDQVVKRMTGHLVKGTYDLPSDDIISAFFPHYHELSHLMVNLKLRRLPLYTQPLLREGVAVYYGGRWGKSQATLMGLAGFLYKEGIVDLDSLLTLRDFQNNSTADIAYPVAGLFNAFLMDILEADAYFELYRNMSGDFETVSNMSRVDVKRRITDKTGHADWPALMHDFTDYIDSELVRKSPVKPGADTGGKVVAQGDGYTAYRDGDWLSFVFTAAEGETVDGNLVFGLDPRLVGGGSDLFMKQYDSKQLFEGYRFGIRYDQNEIGLYDYATDQLLAKYIWGITPSDDYYDEAANTVNISLHRSLIDSGLLKKDDVRLLDK